MSNDERRCGSGEHCGTREKVPGGYIGRLLETEVGLCKGCRKRVYNALDHAREDVLRLTAEIGVPMVRGWAGGGGYDKRAAAMADAVKKITLPTTTYDDGTPHHSETQ